MKAGRPKRIVRTENQAADVLLVREALHEQQISCDPHAINDGAEAIAFIKGVDADSNLPCPDLVLLDLHLPKCNGETILRHLRVSERCGQTPVVVLTSSDSPHKHQSAERHAAVHYFRKPSFLSGFIGLGIVFKEVFNRAYSR